MDDTLNYNLLKEKLNLNSTPTISDINTIISHLTIKIDETLVYGGDTYKEDISLQNLVFENLVFKNLNLSNFDFSESKFENVQFLDCILVRTQFNNTTFDNCKFDRCDMSFMSMTDAQLKNTLFKNSKCYHSYFKWLTLEKCRWEDLVFKAGLLGNTDFEDCIWNDVRFLGGGEFTGLDFPKDFDPSKDFSIY